MLTANRQRKLKKFDMDWRENTTDGRKVTRK
jgi:hypothetical protein